MEKNEIEWNDTMQKINKWIETYIAVLITWMLILGPILDCITSLSINLLHIQLTAIIIIKMLFLGLLLYDLFFISKCRYKKKIMLIVSTIILYMIVFSVQTILHKGMDVLFYECQNMIRTFFFPLVLLSFYNLYVEGRLTVNNTYFYVILIGYLLLILIPILTNTGFNSYADSKVGTIGWFHSSNEIGGILSILFPFLAYYIFRQKKWYWFLILLITIGLYFMIGTKVPILSMAITFTIFLLAYVVDVCHRHKWKQLSYVGILFLVSIVSAILVVPKTSFYKNIQIHLEFLKVESVSDLLTIEKIDHFVFSERIRFMKNTLNHYEQAPLSEKVLGIGYIERYATDEVSTKMIEMDYYDIFFRHGVIGFISYFIPFLWILGKVVRNLIHNVSLPYLTSVLLILLLSLFSGHIITAPSVSILVAYIMIGSLKKEKVA